MNWFDSSVTHRETANTNDIPVTAALEWDSVAAYKQAFVAGGAIVVPASKKILLTDDINATDFAGLGSTFPQYALFHERIGSWMTSGTWLQGEDIAAVPASNTTDEFNARHIPPGGAAVLQTLATGAMTVGTSSSIQKPYLPVALIARGATNRALLGVGDSWMTGRNDTTDATEGGIGYLERATMWDGAKAIATLRVSRASEAAADFVVSNSYRLQLAALCTDAVITYGINDFIGYAHTAAQCVADLKTVASQLRSAGIQKIAVTTLGPRTTGPYTSEAAQGQTVGWETYRQGVNAALVVGPDFDAILDASTILQGTDVTVWAAPGGVAQTTDGIHPTVHTNLATALRTILNGWGY